MNIQNLQTNAFEAAEKKARTLHFEAVYIKYQINLDLKEKWNKGLTVWKQGQMRQSLECYTLGLEWLPKIWDTLVSNFIYCWEPDEGHRKTEGLVAHLSENDRGYNWFIGQ